MPLSIRDPVVHQKRRAFSGSGALGQHPHSKSSGFGDLMVGNRRQNLISKKAFPSVHPLFVHIQLD